jgi:CRISPR-associated endonuclease/helicase Cas3
MRVFLAGEGVLAMTMDPNRLWAKSKKDDKPAIPSLLLHQHLVDVHTAAERVLAATADDQLTALGLVPATYRDQLRGCVLLAAAVHDIGKANDHFQGMICGTRVVQTYPQGLRHEWVTVLMLKGLREWLLPAVGGSETDFAIVEWAVAGHHPAHNHSSPPQEYPPGAGPEFLLRSGEGDFRTILEWLKRTFQLGDAPKLENAQRNLVGNDNVFLELSRWAKAARRMWQEKVKRSPAWPLVAAIKNSLVAADVAGSALPRQNPASSPHWEWIAQSFADKPAPGELAAIAKHRLNGDEPRGFQSDMAASQNPVTYVKAGCGSGKTLGAYMWAAANHPTRRLYFCYPTTGTATEGFKDYLFEPDGELGGIGANLFHSRRDVDFEIILTTGLDTTSSEADAAARIDALEAWSTPIVACTVDTVLGLVQNNRRGVFSWPALAQSAFVFDEIHAYDDRLFGALLRFLGDVPGLPALLMTASLPSAREEALRETLAKRRVELNPIAGPAELEELPRYRKAVVNDNDPLPLVRETLNAGGKVLWVCNTVGRVMDAADRAAEFHPCIYHSRFKYEDRVGRHKAVIDGFDPTKNPGQALAICSQVAEMSLDLSADLLVTDLATVPALIQRLGRLNRRAKKGAATKPFIVVEPDKHLPYTSTDLEAARAWYAKLPADGIQQRHLAEAWEQTSDQPPDPVASAWLDGGPTTSVCELRETSPGITVLMAQDLAGVNVQPKALARLVLPMLPPPSVLNWRSWPQFRGLPVAPNGTMFYDRLTGATWIA